MWFRITPIIIQWIDESWVCIEISQGAIGDLRIRQQVDWKINIKNEQETKT